MTDAYHELQELSKEVKTLEGISRLLEWDQETLMPKGAAHIRAEQLKTLSGIAHEAFTGDKFSKALSRLIDIDTGDIKDSSLPEEKKRSLKEWRRDFLKATKLPKEFVERMAKTTSESIGVWQRARKESNFALFAPWLEKQVEISFEKAHYLGFDHAPYNALLDHYEPDLTEDEVDTIFSELKSPIIALLDKIKQAKQIDNSFLEGEFDVEKQMAFSKEVLKGMGYDFERGRLDLSTHPFSTSFHPTDCRITTRIYTKNIIDCILATIHEGGHSLYEMGLPIEHFGSPLCESISLGVHESQSRFWETRIGQSKPFWEFFLPKIRKLFPGTFDQTSVETFWKGINRVQPTLIRVEADEVTYPLHIILRFEIERALFKREIKVQDIPALWNEKMKEYLGIVPKNDSEGCLQDIHWSMGGFGYFPTYTLGNLYAAHIFIAFERDFPDWRKLIAEGNLVFVRDWLKEKVHRHGRFYTSQELIKKIQAQEFSEKPYLDYLNGKYKEVYNL